MTEKNLFDSETGGGSGFSRGNSVAEVCRFSVRKQILKVFLQESGIFPEKEPYFCKK